jgi:hypothetical protein
MVRRKKPVVIQNAIMIVGRMKNVSRPEAGKGPSNVSIGLMQYATRGVCMA